MIDPPQTWHAQCPVYIMRRWTGVTLQLNQILRRPNEKRLSWMILVTYIARSNRSHPLTSPKFCACHETLSSSFEPKKPDRPTTRPWSPNIAPMIDPCRTQALDKNPSIPSANRKTIRPRSEDNRTITRGQNRHRHLAPVNAESPRAASWRRILHGKYNMSRPRYLPNFHPILHPHGKFTLQIHQILRLPRKWLSHDLSSSHMTHTHTVQCAEYQDHPPTSPNSALATKRMTLMIDRRHTSNAWYNARSIKGHPPTSPNSAPATKHESQDWSWSTWNNARSIKSHPPISVQHHPNLAPATKNDSHVWSSSRIWNTQYKGRSNRSLLFSTLLHRTLRHSASIYSSQLFSTLLSFTILYSTRLYFPLLFSTVLCYALLCSTLLYSSLLCSTLLYSTLLLSLLYSTILYSTLLDSTILYSFRLYYSLLFSTILYSTRLYFPLLFSTVLCYSLLCSTLLYSALLFSSPLFYFLSSTRLFSTLLYSTLLFSTLLYSTRLYYSLLFSTILYSTRLYYSLLDSTILYSSRLYYSLLFSTILYSTRLYFPLLFSTVLCYSLPCSTLLYSALLFSSPLFYFLSSTRLFSTLLYSTLLFSTLLYSTRLYYSLLFSTILYSTRLYYSLLFSTILYSTRLYYSLLFSTILYSTRLYFPLLFSTVLCYSLLCSTLLYSALLFSSPLNSTFLYYSLPFSLIFKTPRLESFSSKLPLIRVVNEYQHLVEGHTWPEWLTHLKSRQKAMESYQRPGKWADVCCSFHQTTFRFIPPCNPRPSERSALSGLGFYHLFLCCIESCSCLHRKMPTVMSKLQLLKDSRTLVRLIIATVIESSKAKCVWYEFLDLVSCMFYSNSNSLWSKYRRQKQCNSRSSLHFGLCFVLKIHLSEWTENATSRGPQLGGKLRCLWTCSFR